MASEIFIDSSAWVAVVDPRDQFHADATRAYAQVLQQGDCWSRLISLLLSPIR